MIRVVRRKFDIAENEKPIFETRSFGVCRDRNIEVDEDVYPIMVSYLEEIEVVTPGHPDVAPHIVDRGQHAVVQQAGPSGSASGSRRNITYSDQATVENNSSYKGKGKAKKTEVEKVASDMDVDDGTNDQQVASATRSTSISEDNNQKEEVRARLDMLKNAQRQLATNLREPSPVETHEDYADDETPDFLSAEEEDVVEAVRVRVQSEPASLPASLADEEFKMEMLLGDAEEAPVSPSKSHDGKVKVENVKVKVERSEEPPNHNEPEEEDGNAAAGPSNTQIPVFDHENEPNDGFNEQGYTGDGRFKVVIGGPAGETQTFMLRQKHAVRKVLHKACNHFGVDVNSSHLELLLEFEDNGETVRQYIRCDDDETIGQAGIAAFAKLRLMIEGDEHNENENELDVF
ncbi:hypothetical protein D9758_003397 [Tetrapyrgos nigripes]|uniref:Uncharacterized protein n=1 Tax=Tetrapyrgos nigripes TaxID=182062 RepID=A0A8H5LVM2_9AGAR|nr:hypothetical protein D9758_003397 [Tetrapyrgos nigripes]